MKVFSFRIFTSCMRMVLVTVLAVHFSCIRAEAASELMAGQVMNIDTKKKVLTVRDIESGKDRTVSFGASDDLKGIRIGSTVRMWVSQGDHDDGLPLKMERICPGHGYDTTGIKKRLRKAADSRGRGLGHGHGRGRHR